MTALVPTRVPRPFDPETAPRVQVDGATADQTLLIARVAGCAPYLAGLIGKEAGWLGAALQDPKAAVRDEIAALPGTAPDLLKSRMRQAKRRVALMTALADLGGVWTLEQVTGALTDLADAACDAALRASLAQVAARGKLPGRGPDTLDDCASLTVLAMGKMGAGELNYSSDIDLICLFDEARFDASDFAEARAGLVRATRQMCNLLSDITAEGYVFRTDLRLRPDPSVTAVCVGMEAAERYYESQGRTWERAAFIKARACAGDIKGGAAFLKTLTPFVWRKHLDFAAIQDAHDMRLAIRAHKGTGGPITLPGHDMKLGRGGIREIEFFTQTRQLIAGGRDPDLRLRQTVPGLRVLAEKGWVPQDLADSLAAHYRAHRTVEHRVQMVRDAQTHALPNSAEGFARLAAMMDMDLPALEADLQSRLEAVHTGTEGFFAPGQTSDVPETPAVDPALMADWPRYPALRSERGAALFERIRPRLLARLADAAQPEEAVRAMGGFLSGLPAGVQLFSLFDANPQLLDLLVDIVSVSPALSAYLARNSAVFDAVIGGGFFDPWPGQDALEAELTAHFSAESDYERQLDAARRWAKEWHFRIGVHHLRGLIAPDAAAAHYAELARACVRALWPAVQAQFARRHGPPPGHGAAILGMGSVGAGRLTSASDLDLIVIYDAAGQEASDGPRPLASRSYYARLTQAMITALTARMAQGQLYEVDMRLRPSGNSGPVATSWESFQSYQRNDAWLWEHLALTRAQVIAGPARLAADIEALRAEVLSTPRNTGALRRALREMRARIAAAKGTGGLWDAKLGRGRMQEVELIAQAGLLSAGDAARAVPAGLKGGVASGLLDAAAAADCTAAYDICFQLQMAGRLISPAGLVPDAMGAAGRAFLARATGFETVAALEDQLVARTARAGAAIDAALGTEDADGEGQRG
ncbi:MAG: glutamine-synthetase adenylyltransferase [Pseudomonadota bacterium]